MKRLTAILMALSLAFPAWAAAELDVNMEQKEENGQTLTVFSAAEAGAAETTAAPEETPDPALATANGLIEARFEQAKAAQKAAEQYQQNVERLCQEKISAAESQAQEILARAKKAANQQ